MGNYYEMVIYAPKTDISDLSWVVKENRKSFNCNVFRALDELKQLCPNIKACSIEKFTEALNHNEIDVNNNWFGVIHIEM